MKKVLVTGADGFIGSHLVEMLFNKGYKVKAFCIYNSNGCFCSRDVFGSDKFDYSEIASVRRGRYDQKSGYRIILKNCERHTFTISKLRLRRLWIQKIRNHIKK